MELRDYLRVLDRRKWTVILITLATVVTVAAGSVLIPPTYAATITLRATTSPLSSVQYADYQYSERLLNTITVLATSGPTLAELAQKLGVPTPPVVTSEIIPNTELIRITVEDRDPMHARDAATAIAAILVDASKRLFTGGGEPSENIIARQVAQVEAELQQARQQQQTSALLSAQEMASARRAVELKEQAYAALLEQYQKAQTEARLQGSALSVAEPATLPLQPSRPRPALNLAVGLLVGLAAGVGLAFLSEHLDSRIHTVEQVNQAMQCCPLSTIPTARGRQRLVLYNGASPQGESFRRLRAAVFDHANGTEPHVVLVTSAMPKEGRSTVAANLAHALAQSERRVIIVDCDWRSASLHKILGLPNVKGLSNVLKPDMDLAATIQETNTSGLCALTSGPLPLRDVPSILEGKRFGTVLAQLGQRFDVVLLDGPALLSTIDASELASAVDGVLLVVSLAQTDQEALCKARQELAAFNANLIGVVVNRASETRA